MMAVTFFDRESHSNPANGTRVDSQGMLRTALAGAAERQPFAYELVGYNSFNLLVGIGPKRGCVQYSSADGSPPYLMASGGDGGGDEFCEFLIGATPTPVPRQYCLPIEEVMSIAVHFVRSNERFPDVAWEEV